MGRLAYPYRGALAEMRTLRSDNRNAHREEKTLRFEVR
jgi:hypothetical protein